MNEIKVGDIVEVSGGGRAVVRQNLSCGWFGVELIESESIEETTDEAMLDFDSGATRNRKEDEFQYEGFLSPLALQMFAAYMHENRHTADGGVRDSDNWQKGIPDESYRDSLLRHILDLWLIYRGWDRAAREGGDLRKALAGAFFNLQGLMHNEALRGLENERGAQEQA